MPIILFSIFLINSNNSFPALTLSSISWFLILFLYFIYSILLHIHISNASSSDCPTPSTSGVFNLLSSRANLHLSYNPAGLSHCRLQNHHGYIKHHHRGMGGSPGDVGEATEGLYIASPTAQLILQPFRHFTYVTAHSTILPPLHLCHRHLTYFTLRVAPYDRGMKKQCVVDELVTASY